MSLRIAIDAGGTFTDIVAIDDKMGKQHVYKTPGTPSDPNIGLLNGVDKVLELAGSDGSDALHLPHGSTTATNALLEHKFDGRSRARNPSAPCANQRLAASGMRASSRSRYSWRFNRTL